ncbi:MAG: hypothetical protein EPO25_08965 [Gammaproteobacteria bacterium]|nr:MAG: hypothetical protein EPO25_08965 [Gammaproteobacteria bacterium]
MNRCVFISDAGMVSKANLETLARDGGERVCDLRASRRANVDFVTFVQHLLDKVCPRARRVHLVFDNPDTRFRVRLEEVLGVTTARRFLRRSAFYYTPRHGSWLNMVKIEIAILNRQCPARRLSTSAAARG